MKTLMLGGPFWEDEEGACDDCGYPVEWCVCWDDEEEFFEDYSNKDISEDIGYDE